MQRSIARREGSPFTGLGPVFMKEFSDHLSSARMMVLMLFVIAFGALTVAPSLTELRNVTESDPFLFLRIFTSASSRVPFSFTAALGFTIPLLAIGLGFDSVNGEFNRRTLSRVLSQPIYRDALLLGKFLGALVTLAVALVALWLIVLGAGLLLLGLPPRGVEVARGVAFLVVAIAYGGVWLAASMLFSVIFRSTATSALCALGVWLFFLIVWPLIVPTIVVAFASPDVMSGRASIDETLAAKLYQRADFYRRTQEPRAAVYTYRYLLLAYPDAPQAPAAAQALSQFPQWALDQPEPRVGGDFTPPKGDRGGEPQ